MIICLNAKNQEYVVSGSREKCITVGCIQIWQSKQAKKIEENQGVCGCWEPLSEDICWFSQNHHLRNFEGLRGDISFNFKDFWGDLASPFYFALFILSPFSEKLQRCHHDLEKALFTNSCIMDLHVKQATTLAKNSSI